MNTAKVSILLFVFVLVAQSVTFGTEKKDEDKAVSIFKSYVNNMVQKVEQAKPASRKREILNNSLDKLINTLNTTSQWTSSEQNKKSLQVLKVDIQEKKNELNGVEGYKRVTDSNLDDFANYIQQDIEQADTLTISLTTLLLGIIILLLLF